jgi:NIPSNAP
MNTIELRNYLLKPGTSDQFVKYFKDHFIRSQNVLGAYTPGQFRIKGEADRFFWIRGFDTMQDRSQFLPAFYGAEVWKEFGPAANDMMLEWHNVHLLKPITGNTIAIDKKQNLLVIDYYTAVDNRFDQLIDLFKEFYIPLFHSYAVNDVSLWVSEMTENDFPRLPVYQDKNLLVAMTGYSSEDKYREVADRLKYMEEELTGKRDELINAGNTLVLYPV